MDWVFPIFGIACAFAIFQFALWSAGSIQQMVFDRAEFKNRLELLRKKFEPEYESKSSLESGWQGFRKFRVARLQQETGSTMSVYLEPEDGLELPAFRPGQHLTFQFNVPAQTKPVVRRYSLSDRPHPAQYRITVKQAQPPVDQPAAPPGIASTFINRQLAEGTILDVKTPAGSFWIDLNDSRPAILLAAGIGITPMISMIKTLVRHTPQRQLLLLYGVANSSDHAFQQELAQLQESYEKLNVVTCYSSPLDSDTIGHKFQIQGRISIDVIQKIVPSNDLPYYMCGPPNFMTSLYDGLKKWGVSDSNIHFEAFGPASIKKKKSAVNQATSDTRYKIDMPKDGMSFEWTSDCNSILEAADENGVPLDSGCRAGSCGTCAVRLLSGSVEYADDVRPNCEDGYILTCVTRPQQNLAIEP